MDLIIGGNAEDGCIEYNSHRHTHNSGFHLKFSTFHDKHFACLLHFIHIAPVLGILKKKISEVMVSKNII